LCFQSNICLSIAKKESFIVLIISIEMSRYILLKSQKFSKKSKVEKWFCFPLHHLQPLIII
jgi:hypothetical protein